MNKIINISDKLNSDKPSIQIGDKVYPVNDGMATVIQFEELAVTQTADSLNQAMVIALGQEAVDEIGIKNISLSNFKVITIAILACMQGTEYDEAATKFPR